MTALRSQYGPIGGENAVFMGTMAGWLGEGTPILFAVGYSGSTASSLVGQTGLMLRQVASVGPTLSIGAGGTSTFGNDTAAAAVETSIEAFRSTYGVTGQVVLVGLSMGFADLMAWAVGHPDEVAGAVSVVGLTNLTEQWTANRTIDTGVTGTAAINAAYGGLYIPATHGPTHSPIDYVESLPFPVTHFYSSTDELIPESSSLAFGELDNVTLKHIGATAHGTPAIQAARLHADFEPTLREYTA